MSDSDAESSPGAGCSLFMFLWLCVSANVSLAVAAGFAIIFFGLIGISQNTETVEPAEGLATVAWVILLGLIVGFLLS